jgi:uncharacterized membrane protein
MSLTPKWVSRVGWQTAALALVCGGIIHIAATLVLPQLATATAFQRLASTLPQNRMRVLPATTADAQLLPFIGPDVRLAVCRFNITDGPVLVTATLPDKGWSLGLYTPQGDNFYAFPAQDLRRTEISITLSPATEKFLGLFNLTRLNESTAAHIAVPENEGLIVIRAPLRGRVYQNDTEANLQRAKCVIQPDAR